MIFRRVTLQTSSKTTFAKNAHTFAKTFYSIIYTTTILFPNTFSITILWN